MRPLRSELLVSQYFVNPHSQANGDNEVHVKSCQYWQTFMLSLGEHASCATAVALAKRSYPRADGCKYCSPSCHRR
jgi:hypothetical protein